MGVNDGNVLMELSVDLQDEVSPKLDNIEQGIEDVGDEAKKTEPVLTNMPKGLEQNAKKATSGLADMRKGIAELGRVGKYSTLALSGGAAFAVKKYVDLESGILKVRTISEKSFNDIKKSAQDLAVKYGISTGQILEGNYQLVSSMNDVAEAQYVLDTTAKLSIAGFTDYGSAMNGVVAVLNGYKKGAAEAGEVADILMTIQNRGITTVNELQASLADVTSVAYNANVGFKDIAAALATITSNKVGTAEAVTGLKGAILELMQEGSQASKMFKQATGQAFDAFMKNHSLVQAIQVLNDYAKSANVSLANVFGNIRAGTSFMNLAGDNLKKFNEDLQAMNNAAGTADKALTELDKGGKRAFEKLKAQAEIAAEKIGEALIPQVKDLTDRLSKVEWDKVFSQENVNKIVDTGKNIAIVAGAMWGLEAAVKGVESAIKVAKGLKWLFTLGSGAAVGTAAVVGGTGYMLYSKVNEKQKSARTTLKEQLKGKNEDEQIQFLESELEKAKARVKELSKKRTTMYRRNSTKRIVELENEKARVKALTEQYAQLQKTIQEQKVKGEKDAVVTKINARIEAIKNEIKEFESKNKSTWDKLGLHQKERLTEKKNFLIKKLEESNRLELGQTLAKEIQEQITQVDNAIKNFRVVESEAIAELKKDIEDFYKNSPKIWGLLGLDDKSQLEEKLSFLKSSLKKAIELGATSLIPSLKSEFDKASKSLVLEINNIKFDKAMADLNGKMKGIKGDGIVNMGRTGIDAQTAEYSAIQDFLKAVGEGATELQKQKVKDLKQRAVALAKDIDLHNKETQARQKFIDSIDKNIAGLNSLAGVFNQVSSISGSKRAGIFGNMLGSVASIGSALKGFNIGDITGMFGGGAGALGTGLASIGTMASVATAGVGIAVGIGKMISAKGKRKAAKIDAENDRQLKLYEDNSKRLRELTEAIKRNSQQIEGFVQKLTDNISKSPTIRRILGGQGSLKNLKDLLVANKNFGDISAVEIGRTRYRSGFRKKSKTTYTNVTLKDRELLKYFGFNADSKLINEYDLFELAKVAKTASTSDLARATGRNLDRSNIADWAKNVEEYAKIVKALNDENSSIFRGSTLGSFAGIDYKTDVQLTKEYTKMLKNMGIESEHYKDLIKSLVEGNNVLITSMGDVRQSFIDGFSSGKDGSLLAGMKGYFSDIFKNVSSVIYDVALSDFDEYFTKMFKKTSEKLIQIKKSGQLDFKGLFSDFDFSELKSAALFEVQYKKQIDGLKQELLNSGVDLSIISQILPATEFNSKINEMQNALSTAMTNATAEHKFDTFTKSLGQSLYDSTKNGLIKAFSESSVYQGLIAKFIDYDVLKVEIDEAGTFENAYKVIEDKLQQFGYRLESNGLGGFDGINNKAEVKANLGNAYYADKNSTVNINITNNFNREVYGIEDFRGVIRETTRAGIQEFMNKPKVLA